MDMLKLKNPGLTELYSDSTHNTSATRKKKEYNKLKDLIYIA